MSWEGRAQQVWHAIMAANQAMLGYLQSEAGYSRAGYHGKYGGRLADAHEWVIASFPQHTSRDGDPQLHVHNAILNRVIRKDPLASRECGGRAWRTLDGAALYAARPARSWPDSLQSSLKNHPPRYSCPQLTPTATAPELAGLCQMMIGRRHLSQRSSR